MTETKKPKEIDCASDLTDEQQKQIEREINKLAQDISVNFQKLVSKASDDWKAANPDSNATAIALFNLRVMACAQTVGSMLIAEREFGVGKEGAVTAFMAIGHYISAALDKGADSVAIIDEQGVLHRITHAAGHA